MRALTFLTMALALIALIACGPAEGEGNKEGDPVKAVTPTETPKSEEEPTKTPESEPTEKPAETPKPTPTRHPEDPPSPTNTPSPTHAPVTPDPTPEPVITSEPHLDGLAGCKTLNIYVASGPDVQYMNWCHDALQNDVQANCRDEEGTEAQLTCARGRLNDAQLPNFKEILPCSAVTDNNARSKCSLEAVNRLSDNMRAVWNLWPVILKKVDSDSGVKEKKLEISRCMVEAGYEATDSDVPLPWQTNDKPATVKPDRNATTQEQQEALRARNKALHKCATDSGIYDLQERLWIAEIQRLMNEDPDSVQSLLDFGLKEALELEGTAPFLMLRQVTP